MQNRTETGLLWVLRCTSVRFLLAGRFDGAGNDAAYGDRQSHGRSKVHRGEFQNGSIELDNGIGACWIGPTTPV